MDGLLETLHDLLGTGYVFSIVVGVVTLIITFVVAHYAVRLTRRVLSTDGVPLPSASIIENIVRIAIWAIGASTVLSTCFNVNVSGLVTAVGVGSVALTFGMQDTLSNFIGGLLVTIMGIVAPGDHVIIGSTEGIVQDLTWRQTIVKDFENNIHTIPNSQINSGEVEKVTPPNMVGTMIAFTNDTLDLAEAIPEMERLAKEAVSEVAELEVDPWILLTQIGEYGTWGKMRFVLKEMSHVREARDAALRAVAPYTRVNADVLRQRTPPSLEVPPELTQELVPATFQVPAPEPVATHGEVTPQIPPVIVTDEAIWTIGDAEHAMVQDGPDMP